MSQLQRMSPIQKMSQIQKFSNSRNDLNSKNVSNIGERFGQTAGTRGSCKINTTDLASSNILLMLIERRAQ